jgi:hypothetical protein
MENLFMFPPWILLLHSTGAFEETPVRFKSDLIGLV